MRQTLIVQAFKIKQKGELIILLNSWQKEKQLMSKVNIFQTRLGHESESYIFPLHQNELVNQVMKVFSAGS